MPKFLPADIVLGYTFLKNFKVSYDFSKSELKIEEPKRRS